MKRSTMESWESAGPTRKTGVWGTHAEESSVGAALRICRGGVSRARTRCDQRLAHQATSTPGDHIIAKKNIKRRKSKKWITALFWRSRANTRYRVNTLYS